MMRIILFCILLFSVYSVSANATSKKVLFIGNSYTFVNDLPGLVEKVANSAGDTIITDSHCKSGYSLQQHTMDSMSVAKIKQGGWDVVVLQEQSQLPSFRLDYVKANSFPYAKYLDSLIIAFNPKSEVLFYRTWGRKNGDTSMCRSWDAVCTYSGMDSLLNERYMMMAKDNHAAVSPVGEVWKYIRENNPKIELYMADESHPAEAGTYASACSFYSAILRKDPTNIKYNFSLGHNTADSIKQAAKRVVYENLNKWFIRPIDREYIRSSK